MKQNGPAYCTDHVTCRLMAHVWVKRLKEMQGERVPNSNSAHAGRTAAHTRMLLCCAHGWMLALLPAQLQHMSPPVLNMIVATGPYGCAPQVDLPWVRSTRCKPPHKVCAVQENSGRL